MKCNEKPVVEGHLPCRNQPYTQEWHQLALENHTQQVQPADKKFITVSC